MTLAPPKKDLKAPKAKKLSNVRINSKTGKPIFTGIKVKRKSKEKPLQLSQKRTALQVIDDKLEGRDEEFKKNAIAAIVRHDPTKDYRVTAKKLGITPSQLQYFMRMHAADIVRSMHGQSLEILVKPAWYKALNKAFGAAAEKGKLKELADFGRDMGFMTPAGTPTIPGGNGGDEVVKSEPEVPKAPGVAVQVVMEGGKGSVRVKSKDGEEVDIHAVPSPPAEEEGEEETS